MPETSGFSSSRSFAQSRNNVNTLMPAWRLAVAMILSSTVYYISSSYRDDIRAMQQKTKSAEVFLLGSYVATTIRKGWLKLWYLYSS
jgi:hypothetical protein